MPLRLAFMAVVCLGFAARADAADDFPYTAFISADEVHVRSGPGENYYPVLKLNRGDQVQVYRHDPGGWYAVRPPEGSFSWVSGEFIQPGGGNIGVVIGDRVVARVGSAFSDIRDVIQVRLDRDEQVDILEAKRFNAGPAAQTWYKIAPPAGEFRWISGKFVEREPRTAAAPRERNPRNNLILARLARSEDADVEEPDDERRPIQVRPRVALEEERIPARDRRDADDRVAEVDITPLPDTNTEPRWNEARRRRRAPDGIAPDDAFEPAPVASVPGRAAELGPDLDELDLELSAMVAEDTSVWDFSELRSRAEATLARCETAVDRGRARVLLTKIDRFDDIRQRYVAVMDTRYQTDRRNRELAANAPAATRRPYTDEPRYDGVGKLAQIVSSKVGSPRYALLDETGEVKYYITPAPGVSLRNYVGREIGVNGTLGFLPEQQRQHVTARQIVPIEGTKLR
jgi:uncharacterized protein YraI